jgi:CheY-like chemotaxis protein
MPESRSALVVDDNALNSNLVSVFLKRLAWVPEVCGDGLGALQALRTRRFGLVLLDLRMPDIGGEEVCRRIRDELGLRDLPVVAYTAHGMPEERERMLALGFDALLIKPISFEDVRQLCEGVAHA